MRDTIAVYALWRDSEPHIQRTLSQLEDLETLDYDFEYYFYENDSKDNTVEILKDWIQERKGAFFHENFKAKKFGSVPDEERMHLLSQCRNKCRDLMLKSKSKYTLLLDSDIIFNNKNFTDHILTMRSFKDCALATPNIRQDIEDLMHFITEDSYYDIHAFLDRFNQTALPFTDCPFKNGIDRMNWSLGQLIEVNSAFGGFAMIRTKILKKVKWSTEGLCEHINFCRDILDFGKIYVNPKNSVYTKVDKSKLNMNAMHKIAQNRLKNEYLL